MGYLTDFVVAAPSELQSVLEAGSTPDPRSGFEAAVALETFELARLWCLLHGEHSEDDFDRRVDALDEAYRENAEGAWAVALPLVFVREMAALTDSAAATLTDAWVQSDELEHVSAAQAEQLMGDLRALAARALQVPGATINVRVGE